MEITKKAKVIDATYATIATSGTLPVSPLIKAEIGQIYKSEFTNTVVIPSSQVSRTSCLKT